MAAFPAFDTCPSMSRRKTCTRFPGMPALRSLPSSWCSSWSRRGLRLPCRQS